jgi:MFS transporter, ACDE family, multidrug resistance protein
VSSSDGFPKPPPTPPGIRPLHLDPNLHVVFSVTLTSMLAVSAVAPAFPDVARALDVAPEAVGLLITVFTLPGILLTPVLGILADRYGRKQVLVPALVLFALAGSACSLARSFEVLLALRFLQGVGAASLGSLNVTIMGDLYRGRVLTTAMGYNASVLSLGTAAYPAIGGALALLGWYVPFALPILGLATAAVVLFRLETVRLPKAADLRPYLRDALRGMGTRKVVGLLLVTLLTFVVLYGAYTIFIPLHLSARFGSSSFGIGLIMTVGSLSTAITASRLGLLSRYIPQERLIHLGFALYALAFVVIPWLPGHWWVAVPVALFGVAQGLNYPCVLALLAGLAPTEHRGIFMSANSMALWTGQTLGPLVMAAAYGLWGMDGVFLAAAGICLAVAGLIPLMIGVGERERAF